LQKLYEDGCSVVGVPDNPAFVLHAASLRGFHTVTQEDLAEFVVGHDDGKEGEGRHGEMRERDLSRSEHNVEERNVAEEGNKDGLEKEAEVGVVVDHSLLRDGEVSGLADNEIRPLHAHNRDQVTGLGVSKGLGGVADLSLGDVGVSVEGKSFVLVLPSAAGPGVGFSLTVEETEIDLVVLGTIPVKSSSEVFVSEVGVTLVGLGRVVHIGGVGEVTFDKRELEAGNGAETIIVQDVEVGEETGGGLDHTDLEVGEGDEFGVHKMISLGVTGVTFHDIKLGVLVGEGDGGDHVSSKVNAEDKDSREGEGNLEEHEEQEGGDLGDVRRQGVRDRLLQVIEDEATFLNTADDGGEVVVEEEHIGGVLGDIGATSHSNTDVGLLDGRGVVDTVTSDSDDVTEFLAGGDDEELLGGGGSGKDDLGLADPVHDFTSLLNFVVIETFLGGVNVSQVLSVDNNRLSHAESFTVIHVGVSLLDGVVLELGLGDDVDLVGNGGGSGLLVTSDHDNLDSGGLALQDGDVDLGAGRIVQGNETEEAQVPHGEPTFFGGAELVFLPRLPLLDIELVILGEFSGFELGSGETEDTLSHGGEAVVGSVIVVHELVIHGDFLTSDEHLGNTLDNLIGGTLDEHGDVVFLVGGFLNLNVHVSDDAVELDVGGERNLVLVAVGSLDAGVSLTEFVDSAHGPCILKERLRELDETSLGGISLDSSLHVGELSFFIDHLLRVGLVDGEVGVGFLGHILALRDELNVLLLFLGDLGTELIIGGRVGEVGGGGESDTLDEGLEAGVVVVVLGLGDVLQVGIGTLFLFSGKRVLVDLVVDIGVDDLSVVEDLGYGHSVLSESSGLVGADAGGGAKGLNRLEVLNQHHLGGHGLGSQGEGDGDSGEETFGHVSDNDTNHENEVSDDIVGGETEQEEANTEGNGHDGDDLDESLNLDGERSLSGLSSDGQVGDSSDDGSVSSSEDDTLSGTTSALGSEEGDVSGLEDVLVLVLEVTEEVLGLTSEGGVVDLHLVDLEEDKIGGDVVTTLDLDEITLDELTGGEGAPLSVSADFGGLGDEVLEIIHEGGSLGGLHVGEDTGEEHDDSEHDTEVQVSLVFLVFLDGVSNETEEGTEPEEEREETSLLFEEDAIPWLGFLLGEGVFTILSEGLGGHSSGQTLGLIGLELLAELLSGPHMVVLITKNKLLENTPYEIGIFLSPDRC